MSSNVFVQQEHTTGVHKDQIYAVLTQVGGKKKENKPK